jgi:hypothetical protein
VNLGFISELTTFKAKSFFSLPLEKLTQKPLKQVNTNNRAERLGAASLGTG